MFALLSPRLWIALALAGVLAFTHFTAYRSGKASTQAKWDAEKVVQQQAFIKEQAANAAETDRRLKAQQKNQELQNAEIAQARAAADRNARESDRLRREHAKAADIWGNTLRNSPTSADLAAASEAIRVSTDLLGRANRRADILASYSDAARAAGLKCERDYDALTK